MPRARLSELYSISKEILRQGRPHIMPLGFVSVLAGISSISTLNLPLFLKAFLLSFVGSFTASAPNDYFDAESDRENGRKVLTGAYVQDKDLGKIVATASLLLTPLIGLVIGSFTGFCLIAITILSVLYSVPPFRLKGRAPLDSICNGLGAFLLFGAGVGLAGGGLGDVISGAYWFSIVAAGAHGISAIPDIEQDRSEGLRTLPILIGKKATIAFTQTAIFLSVIFEDFSGLTSTFLLMLAAGLFILWKDWEDIKFNHLLLIGVAVFFTYFTVYVYTRGVLNIRI